MKKCVLSLVLVLFSIVHIFAQSVQDYAVQVSARVQNNPPQINLHWPAISGSKSYTIYRKLKEDAKWGTAVASLGASATGWTDNSVTVGIPYEYKIFCQAAGNNAFGYILAGIDVPAIENRGRLILLVDDTLATPLKSEIQRLTDDMRGDGWVVLRHNVKRNDLPINIKKIINADQKLAPKANTAVFLLGHVPVPYSGNFAPDGHANHWGAWPADCFYGDLKTFWDDFSVNNDTSSWETRTHNIPGDGKFDFDVVPYPIQLEIGRVDLSDMPAFKTDEISLVKRYLDKDHMFRHKMFTAREKALVDDNFGTFNTEAFASSGYKAFAPMFGDSNIISGDYLDSAKNNSFLWEYGCGGGWFQGASGIGTTDSFAADSIKSVFSMMFGSYFGDWGSTDNFLRAPLASKGWTLTNCWSGRPQWIMHHMALGENIGYCARISQWDTLLYYRHPFNLYGRLRHTALMGDPTLRMHIIAPPKDLQLSNSSDSSTQNTKVTLQWTASGDNVLGYNIYRSLSPDSPFTRVNAVPVSTTSFIDSTPPHGVNYYMVRAIALQKSASGTYYNLSEGTFSNSTYSFRAGIEAACTKLNFSVYPNPAHKSCFVSLSNPTALKTTIALYDIAGKEILLKEFINENTSLDIDKLTPGVYTILLSNESGRSRQKLVIY